MFRMPAATVTEVQFRGTPMKKPRELRALIVDDEKAVQTLIKRALSQQGFTCDTAGDGNEAERLVARSDYDAVVTDLRMPNKHGHALATHLLKLPRRPVIVVHTSVIEPKLARDLLARGVDDIMFKPFDLSILAAKMRVLVDRRAADGNRGQARSGRGTPLEGADGKADELRDLLHESSSLDVPVPILNIKSKLASLSRILPISKAALDVYNMTSTDQWETEHIAAAIQRDPTLAAEVLRLANSSFYNPSGQRVAQLERAVVQIGQKRVGELSLATNALAALTSAIVPWMDIGLTWKQSMAAGLALERIIDCGKHQRIEEGLLLSAIMHPLGRVVLGTLYPKQYELMIQRCADTGESLLEQERRVFTLDHCEVAADLLSTWNIPAEVHLPLKHILEDFRMLARLPEPTRTKVELVKLAILVGRTAIGSWETWDWLDLPPGDLLEKLRLTSLSEIIAQTKEDVDVLATFHADGPAVAESISAPVATRVISYCDLSQASCGLLEPLLGSIGIRLVKRVGDDLLAGTDNVLVNCLGNSTPPALLDVANSSRRRFLIVSDAASAEANKQYGRTIALPMSYSRLRTACWSEAHGMS
jgi:HD-like signal output (HDOD) protein/ActR/RegA family two-component response regulator